MMALFDVFVIVFQVSYKMTPEAKKLTYLFYDGDQIVWSANYQNIVCSHFG